LKDDVAVTCHLARPMTPHDVDVTFEKTLHFERHLSRRRHCWRRRPTTALVTDDARLSAGVLDSRRGVPVCPAPRAARHPGRPVNNQSINSSPESPLDDTSEANNHVETKRMARQWHLVDDDLSPCRRHTSPVWGDWRSVIDVHPSLLHLSNFSSLFNVYMRRDYGGNLSTTPALRHVPHSTSPPSCVVASCSSHRCSQHRTARLQI